jgi:hypothetical protein
MKNVPFSIVDDVRESGNLFTNLTTFLAYDRQRKDVYFNRIGTPNLSDRFETAISPKQAISRLKQLGYLKNKNAPNKLFFKHVPTGQQLSIAVNNTGVLIGSHFLAADDAPVSYLTDTRQLLNELLCEEVV